MTASVNRIERTAVITEYDLFVAAATLALPTFGEAGLGQERVRRLRQVLLLLPLVHRLQSACAQLGGVERPEVGVAVAIRVFVVTETQCPW